MDGYLISNFLGRFDGPRWNMITPEAIARVDVLYGPFSAIYPGNSIGTTVVTSEREPRAFEAPAHTPSAPCLPGSASLSTTSVCVSCFAPFVQTCVNCPKT